MKYDLFCLVSFIVFFASVASNFISTQACMVVWMERLNPWSRVRTVDHNCGPYKILNIKEVAAMK